jgi:hypothetical protein
MIDKTTERSTSHAGGDLTSHETETVIDRDDWLPVSVPTQARVVAFADHLVRWFFIGRSEQLSVRYIAGDYLSKYLRRAAFDRECGYW